VSGRIWSWVRQCRCMSLAMTVVGVALSTSACASECSCAGGPYAFPVSAEWYGQFFAPCETGQLVSIQVQLYAISDSHGSQVFQLETRAGLPIGRPTNPQVFRLSVGLNTLVLEPPLPAVENETYFFALSTNMPYVVAGALVDHSPDCQFTNFVPDWERWDTDIKGDVIVSYVLTINPVPSPVAATSWGRVKSLYRTVSDESNTPLHPASAGRGLR